MVPSHLFCFDFQAMVYDGVVCSSMHPRSETLQKTALILRMQDPDKSVLTSLWDDVWKSASVADPTLEQRRSESVQETEGCFGLLYYSVRCETLQKNASLGSMPRFYRDVMMWGLGCS
jgi:hypothetical protein